MPKYNIIALLIVFCCAQLSAQTKSDSLILEAYVFEQDGIGFVRGVEVFFELDGGSKISGTSNDKGTVKIQLPRQSHYNIRATKSGFEVFNLRISAETVLIDKEKWFVKIPLRRAAGYMLDASLTDFVEDAASGTAQAYGIEGATIEIYNNTLQREELRLEGHKSHSFGFFLQQGNEYIFMIRKKGYYTKRLRANVNVNGCILCMEGFGTITPGVADNLSKNNTIGVLVTNISMKKVSLNETVRIENIYYDVAKSELRKDAMVQLDKLAELLRDNPQVIIELSSHTDCRGSKERNQRLSQSRADGVVKYLTTVGKIPTSQITGKGMGEEKPVNSCTDGVDCSEEMHQPNRRTEFTVVDIRATSEEPSLAAIMQEANMEKILAATSTEVYVPTDAEKNTPQEWHTSIKLNKSGAAILPQVVDTDYTGFKIELFNDSEAPTINEPTFHQFELTYLYLDDNNMYSILLGDYPSAAAAQADLQELRKTYRQAQLVEFEAGQMK
jgi:outer membrane protein OmpA-like peptidoglycan-associated protein